MKARLAELGETFIGAAWWGGSWAWGLVLTALLLLTPLLFANLAIELVETLPATVAVGIGVIAAFAIGLPPWDGDERIGLLLVIGGTTLSVIGWELLRGTADAGTLLVALALTAAGWPLRRAISRRWPGLAS